MSPRTVLILLALLAMVVSPLTSNADEADARRLINALGCKGCHKIQGDGGSLAPELGQIGSRMTRDQIKKHLANHGTSHNENFMPSYDTTSQAELTLLSDFLYNLL